jgi:hypothetical protein
MAFDYFFGCFQIHVYKDGYKIEYNGVRDPETFVSWLMDIPDDPVTIINDVFDLEEFEELEDKTVRIIGYFGGNFFFNFRINYRFFWVK